MTWICECGHANEPRYRYRRKLGRRKKVNPGKTCRACRRDRNDNPSPTLP